MNSIRKLMMPLALSCLLSAKPGIAVSDLAENDGQGKWISIEHIHAASNQPTFRVSPVRFDESRKKDGKTAVGCDISARVPAKQQPAGYAEIRWQAASPVDLKTAASLAFSYCFSQTLPPHTTSTMFLNIGGKVVGTKSAIPLTADGQWHEAAIPVADFFTTPIDGEFNQADSISWCFYVYPQTPDQDISFSFLLDAITFVAKTQEPGKPAVLCLTPGTKETSGQTDVEHWHEKELNGYKELKQLGIERGWHVGWDNLSLNQLKVFNAIIFVDYPFLTPGAPVPPEIQKSIALFQKYASEGGGLFLAGDIGYHQAKFITMNEILKPMNGKVYVELVKDDQNKYTLGYPYPGVSFSWTGVIAKHPVTEGVEGLYYGTGFCEPASPNTMPAEGGPEWQVLVRGMPSAASYKVDQVGYNLTGVGAYDKSPVMMMVREYGKGRVVVWPMMLNFSLMGCGLFDKAIIEQTAGGRKSNGDRMLYNLIQWLVEPSIKLDDFGGFVAQPVKPLSLEDEPGFQQVDWTIYRDINPMYKNAYLGLIGAMSTLSSGKNSPEEMIEAAKSAGYQFIALTEDLETLTQENWDKLIAVCKAKSDAAFQAFPGLYYKPVTGAEYVYFGGIDDLCYPIPKWLTEVDGKRRIKENDCIVRGMKQTPPVIMVYPARNPRPLRVNSQFYGFAVHTYEGGTLADDAFKSYLALQRESLELFATAVHFVKSVDDIKAARAGGLQTFIRANSVDTVPRSIQGMHQSLNNPGWCKPAYASSGPEVQFFYADNWGTTDLSITGCDRHRLQVLIRSDIGLKEVTIYDNTEVFRRFALNGTNEFRENIDNYHDQQHSYVAVALDTKGGKAISWGRETEVQECSHSMCGDNWNDMPTGKYGRIEDAEANPFSEGYLPAPAQFWGWPGLMNQGGHGGFAALKQSGMVTRFGWILDYSMDHVYQESGQPGIAYDNLKIIPNPNYNGKVRHYMITGRRPKQNVHLWEGQATFTRDVPLKGTPGFMATTIHSVVPTNIGFCVYPGNDGKPVLYAKKDGVKYWDGPLNTNEYIGCTPPAYGLFNLDSKPLIGCIMVGQMSIVGLGSNTATISKGDSYSWRILGVYGGRESDQMFLEDVKNKMGLAGPPAYQVKPVKGKVIDTRFFLNLASEQYGFRGIVSRADLPVVLSGFISGLNARWPAGIWYKGENTLKIIKYPPEFIGPQDVIDRKCVDEIIRMGILDGVGFFQLDIEEKDRDVFIGNLVTADNPDLRLSLIRDPGKAYVIAHNPTDKPVAATLTPGAGFDLYGQFSRRVNVDPGSSVTVDLLSAEHSKRSGVIKVRLSRFLFVTGVVIILAFVWRWQMKRP